MSNTTTSTTDTSMVDNCHHQRCGYHHHTRRTTFSSTASPRGINILICSICNILEPFNVPSPERTVQQLLDDVYTCVLNPIETTARNPFENGDSKDHNESRGMTTEDVSPDDVENASDCSPTGDEYAYQNTNNDNDRNDTTSCPSSQTMHTCVDRGCKYWTESNFTVGSSTTRKNSNPYGDAIGPPKAKVHCRGTTASSDSMPPAMSTANDLRGKSNTSTTETTKSTDYKQYRVVRSKAVPFQTMSQYDDMRWFARPGEFNDNP